MKEKKSRKTFRIRLDEAISGLREDILSGKYAIGEFLPSEPDLSAQYELSNKSVRKALDILVQEGLIEKIAKVGNRVAAPNPEGASVIRFGYHSTTIHDTVMDTLLSEFHRLYPHIRVQTVEYANARYPTVVKDHLDADLLDVVSINHFNYREIAENGRAGIFQPFSANPALYPFLNRAFTSGSELHGMPFVFSPVVLCYNRGHFAEKGVDEPDSSWTWDDLLRNAKRLAVENKRFGFYFHLFSHTRWPIFLLQSGGAFREEDGHGLKADREKLNRGLKTCRDIIYETDVFPTMLAASEADVEELFLQQKVSMILTTYFGLNELKEADFDFDIAPIPHLDEFRTMLVVIGLAVNRKSKVKEAAHRLVEFLLSPAAQTIIRKQTYSLPAVKSVAETNGLESEGRPRRFPLYREIVPSYKLFTDLQLNARQLSVLFRESKLYWTKLQDMETLCGNVEEAFARNDEGGEL